MKVFLAALVASLCSLCSNAQACAVINGPCLSSVGEQAWIELPQPAKDYFSERGVKVTGGIGTHPLRIVLSGYTFEIRPADAHSAHVWLVEGDDPRDKVVVFVLESAAQLRQVCEVSSYETEHWPHQCHASRSVPKGQTAKR